MFKITNIKVFPVLNSRAERTIKVYVYNGDKFGWTIVPSGKSKGEKEAKEIDAFKAVENINKIIAPKLIGLDPTEQEKIDKILIELDGTKDKSKLGVNAILGISLACSRLGAMLENKPLFVYLQQLVDLRGKNSDRRGIGEINLLFNLVNGGLHGASNLSFQEYLVIPEGKTIREKIEKVLVIYLGLKDYLRKQGNYFGVGDEGGFISKFSGSAEPFMVLKKIVSELDIEDINFGMDAASSTFYKSKKYDFDNKKITPNDLLNIYKDIKGIIPLVYLEDPFEENDFENFAKIKLALSPSGLRPSGLNDLSNGKGTMIVGDDLTATNPKFIKEAFKKKAISGVIIKPNQIGTLTETLEAIKTTYNAGGEVIISHRSGESEDNFIADLAVAVGAWGAKFGAPARSERTSKYNRLMEIESGRANSSSA